MKIALEVAVAQGDAHLEGTCLSELGLTYLRMQRSRQAIELASRSLQKFTELQLELSTAADLGIVALAYLAQDEREAARKFAIQARTILDEVDGDDMDYPQRDYLHCYQVFAALGETRAAAETLAAACRLLQRLSGAISDEAMRESFLHNVAHNRAILEAAASAGILSDYF